MFPRYTSDHTVVLYQASSHTVEGWRSAGAERIQVVATVMAMVMVVVEEMAVAAMPMTVAARMTTVLAEMVMPLAKVGLTKHLVAVLYCPKVVETRVER